MALASTTSGGGLPPSGGQGGGARGARPLERRVKKVIVPEVTGLLYRDAIIVLQQAGLPPPLARYTEAYADESTVVEQYPIRGQLVDSTTQVSVSIAKSSWMAFLPQVFQVSVNNENQFLHEFMWVFQQLHEHIDQVLTRMPWLFRPQETDPAFLPWLASWIALGLEADWPVEQQRKWLRCAPALYSIRGTKQALESLLEMYTGLRPRLIENEWPFEPMRVGVSSEIGVTSVILPAISMAHCFVVELPVQAGTLTDDQIIRIHRVIQAEKPAHTMYFLTFSNQAKLEEEEHGLVIGEAFVEGESDVDWSEEP